jgi:hypothetical protein
MKNKSEKKKGINRRTFLPILGTGLLLPLLPARAQDLTQAKPEEEYHTLLKADGTTVRIKKSSLENSKVVKKNISNTELRNWLKKDLENS